MTRVDLNGASWFIGRLRNVRRLWLRASAAQNTDAIAVEQRRGRRPRCVYRNTGRRRDLEKAGLGVRLFVFGLAAGNFIAVKLHEIKV